MATRPYIVTETATGKQRLIEAASQSQALGHVAQSVFTVKTASTKDVMALMKQGIVPEETGAGSAAPGQ